MPTYKEIKGTTIQSFATDPSNAIDGQVWYNTTSNELKNKRVTQSGWASGGNLATARYSLAGAGIQTAGLAFGGGPPATAATEEYDGTSWTAGGNLATARGELAGAGTQTAGLAFGGISPSVTGATEEYTGGGSATLTISTS